jgi:TusA-related sulfurtransferase
MARATYPKPHITLDMTGAACPGPMLGAKRVLDDLLAGEVMLLVSDCPATKDDLYSWPNYADVEILKTRKMAHGGTGYYIRKGKARRVSPHAVRKGEVLQLISDCPGIRADVRSWVKATGLELADARESASGEYQFYIRKR